MILYQSLYMYAYGMSYPDIVVFSVVSSHTSR